MADYATLKVRPDTKKVTSRLAEKYEMNMLDFMEAMAVYFDKTGVNPKDLQILSPAEELKKFRDTIVSFMRKQEKEFILPVFSRVDSLAARFIQYIELEAPKRNAGDVSGLKEKISLNLSDQTISTMAEVKTETAEKDDQELINLRKQLDELNLKYSTIKDYLSNIVNHTQQRSTGLSAAPVIDLPMAEINDYKNYLKRL